MVLLRQEKNVLYLPYGAYELKATYQHHMLLAMGVTVLVIALAVIMLQMAVPQVETGLIDDSLGKDTTIVISLPPPVTIDYDIPEFGTGIRRPAGKVGIPVPVPDEELFEPDVQIASNEELAIINEWDGLFSDSGSLGIPDGKRGGGEYVPPLSSDELHPGDFVKVEHLPVMVYAHKPKYPSFAEQAGLTGKVVIWAVVDEEGKVVRALVYVSSGIASLDEAALASAYKCRFRPGIQNGRPVTVPVTFTVEFELDN